jgi:hypothetical protein
MSNALIATQHTNQISQDDNLYLSSNDPESVRGLVSAGPSNGLSYWIPGSGVSQCGETSQQPTMYNYGHSTNDLYLTQPAVIAEGLEPTSETEAPSTMPNEWQQEQFIRHPKNIISDLMKANNDLEDEIAALKKRWGDYAGGPSTLYSPWFSRRRRPVVPKYEPGASLYRQRIVLEEKLSKVNLELPSLKKEVDREGESSLRKISTRYRRHIVGALRAISKPHR